MSLKLSSIVNLTVMIGRRLTGERPLNIQGTPSVGFKVRERGRSAIYAVTRHERSGDALIIWGKPTGLHQSGEAAIEWAEDQLRALRRAGKVFTRAEEHALINKVMRRYGRGEESAAAIVNDATLKLGPR